MGIPGVRYRCRIRRVSAGGLDSLSQFILDHVLDKEDRISVLLQSFGLPRGVIENALTDLLESNRVNLDVLRARISKSASRPDRREYRVGPPLDVWQDECTGAILPLRMVQDFARPPSPSGVSQQWLRSHTKTRDLLDLPAARALGSLLSADPTLRVDEGGWIADGLIDPEKIGPFDLYLPVDQVEIDGKNLQFVTGTGLPLWVTRSWSFELATSELGVSGSEARPDEADTIRTSIELAAASANVQTATRIFDQANLEYHLQGWKKNLHDSLRGVLEFAVQRNSFALEQLKSRIEDYKQDLIGRIVASGRIRFERSTTNHFREVWAIAHSYLLVVHRGFTVDELEQIWTSTEGNGASAVHLILLDCSGADASIDVLAWLKSRAERELGGELVLIRTEAAFESELCVVDGSEVRVGSLRALLAGEPVVIAQGRTVMQHLAASISKEISPREPGGWWVLRQLSPAFAESIQNCDDLDSVIEEFENLNNEVKTLIDEVCESVSDGVEVDSGESKAEKPLAEAVEGRILDIESGAFEVCNRLLEQFPKHRMLVVPIPGADLFSVRKEALEISGSEQGHQVDIILNGLPRRVVSGPFVAQLRKVIANGRTLRVIVCQSSLAQQTDVEITDRLEVIRQQLGAENLAIQVSKTELPCGVIVDRKTIAIGWGDWFDAMAPQVGQFGFIVESEELANQICRYQSG